MEISCWSIGTTSSTTGHYAILGKRYNGYTLFWFEATRERSRQLGESAEDCRRRVMESCRDMWNASQQLREDYKAKARSLNQQLVSLSEASEANVVAPCSVDEEVVQHKPKAKFLPPAKAFHGCGPLGIGDSKFPLSSALLEAKQNEESSFIQNHSMAWKRRTSGTIARGQPFTKPMKLCCTEDIGICWKDITDKRSFRSIEKHLLKFVAEYRKKHVLKGKNLGPNMNIKRPLLVSWQTGSLEFVQYVFVFSQTV